MRRTQDLFWVAGLLEGEGCFYVTPPSRGTAVSVICEMTDEDVLVKLAKILRLGWVREKPRKTVNGKTTYRYTASGSQAIQIMLTIYPLMSGRRKEKIEECVTKWRSVGGPGSYKR